MHKKVKFEKGYIGIADKLWCDLCSSNELTLVNIWTRKSSFKAVSEGSPVFFLEKGTRLITGFGVLNKFETLTVYDTWQKYNVGNGANTYNDFLKLLNLPDNDKVKDFKLGNIIIENVIWCNSKFPIDSTNIHFHKATVSGKTISKIEADELIKLINTKND